MIHLYSGYCMGYREIIIGPWNDDEMAGLQLRLMCDRDVVIRGVVIDTLGYSWIPFFWILGKFLGSKYPSIQKKTCFYAKLPDTWDS